MPLIIQPVDITATIIIIVFDLEEYQRALEQGVVLSAYARVMFVGPGGVGKSSFLCGLMNKPLPVAESTQLANTMTVKPATKKWASAGADSNSFWREVTDDDEIMEIVGLVHLVARASAGHSTSSRFISLLQSATSESSDMDDKSVNVNTYSDHHNMIVQKVVNDILKQAVEIAEENPNAEAPEEEVLIIVWDCGGQPIFLDILPAFLTQRTMFLLFYDARRSLVDPCIIRTFHGGKLVNQKPHKATTLELMLEWMSSIHAMLGSVESGETPKFPRIIPVGTHGDDPQVKDKKGDIIHQLNSECKDKAFVHLLKDSVLVDNTTAGQGENEDPGFSYIRRETYEFAGKGLSIPTPIAWVLFRRVFKKVVTESNSPIVFYEVVEKIAVECGIPSTAVSSAIKFYHDLAVFFHYSEVPSLQNYVIADPQWLICQFAKILTLEGFAEFHNELLWKPLRENGVLVQPLYEEVWKNNELPSQSLVDLLVHFLLAAPIEEVKVTNLPGKEYFVSLVLPAYTCVESQGDDQSADVTKQAAPLHLLFNTYYVPPGFFSRLVTTLSSKPKFRVAFSEGVYCDRIILLYGHANCEIDEVILTKCKNSIEITILRTQKRPQRYMPFSLACHNILTIISDCFPSILHWLRGIKFQYAFVCDHCPKELDTDAQHYIQISFNDPVYTTLRCDRLQYVHLTPSHHEWLLFCEDTQVMNCKVAICFGNVILLFQCTPDIRPSELEDVGKIIQSEGKVEELAETLEMTNNLKALAGDLNQAFELLLAWSEEMKPNPNLRSHLAHHLSTIGMDSIAYR
jgi:GTPase SAR1 family protein